MEQPSSSPPRGGYHPSQGPRSPPFATQSYKPTDEEQKVLKECRSESFYYRSLPFAVAGMGTTQLLIQRNILSTGRYGPFPKLLFAAFCGYSLGKLSYINACKSKILALPNSPMAQMIRNGTPQYMRNLYQAQEESEQEFSSGNSGYKNDDHHVNLDLDTSSSRNSDDLDVSKRIAEEEEEKHKAPEMTKTYRDLRRESRSKDGGAYGRRDPEPQPPPPQPKDEFKLGRSKYLKKNQYGDVIYDE